MTTLKHKSWGMAPHCTSKWDTSGIWWEPCSPSLASSSWPGAALSASWEEITPSASLSLMSLSSSGRLLEKSSKAVPWKSPIIVKSTSASRLEVELTVMLEHFRSMAKWLSFRKTESLSWSCSSSPVSLSGALCRGGFAFSSAPSFAPAL